MPTTWTFVFYKIHLILTQSLRLKSYLKPFLHFGLPLDQNGLDVCPDETGLEGLLLPPDVLACTGPPLRRVLPMLFLVTLFTLKTPNDVLSTCPGSKKIP
jgi:hypothetical protein